MKKQIKKQIKELKYQRCVNYYSKSKDNCGTFFE